MFADFLVKCECYNHIKLIVYEVIKNRQNNHIIPLYFNQSKQIIFRNLDHSSFNIMLVKVTNFTFKIPQIQNS